MGKIDIRNLDIYSDDRPSSQNIRKKKFDDDDRPREKKKK